MIWLAFSSVHQHHVAVIRLTRDQATATGAAGALRRNLVVWIPHRAAPPEWNLFKPELANGLPGLPPGEPKRVSSA